MAKGTKAKKDVGKNVKPGLKGKAVPKGAKTAPTKTAKSRGK